MEKQYWHVMTITEGGTVSLVQNMTEEVARRVFKECDPWGGYPPEMYHGDPGRIQKRVLIGPNPGAEMP